MSEEKFLYSNFKKLEINPKCAKKIARIQSSFERFANHMVKVCRENKESTQGMIRMQEACVWFCRAIAVMSAYDIHRKKEVIVEIEPQKVEEYIEEEGDNVGNVPPIIIVKKKRVFIKK
jgi:hypothetical protein